MHLYEISYKGPLAQRVYLLNTCLYFNRLPGPGTPSAGCVRNAWGTQLDSGGECLPTTWGLSHDPVVPSPTKR